MPYGQDIDGAGGLVDAVIYVVVDASEINTPHAFDSKSWHRNAYFRLPFKKVKSSFQFLQDGVGNGRTFHAPPCVRFSDLRCGAR